MSRWAWCSPNVWRRTGRLWPLIIAHGIIDSVAYVGYALAAGQLGWLS